MRDLGNVVIKNQYPVTKSEKSFHFDDTLVARIFLYLSRACFDRTTFLIPPSSTGSPKMRESGTPVRHFLKRAHLRDRDTPLKTVRITGLRENFGRDDENEEPYWGPSITGSYLVYCSSSHARIVLLREAIQTIFRLVNLCIFIPKRFVCKTIANE